MKERHNTWNKFYWLKEIESASRCNTKKKKNYQQGGKVKIMKITEDSLFEVKKDYQEIFDMSMVNTVKSVSEGRQGAKDLTDGSQQPEGHKEGIEDLSPEELVDFIQDNGDLEFSKPGEVEKESKNSHNEIIDCKAI